MNEMAMQRLGFKVDMPMQLWFIYEAENAVVPDAILAQMGFFAKIGGAVSGGWRLRVETPLVALAP